MNTFASQQESPLHVESLESRDTPAGNVTATMAQGVLLVTGDAADNQFTVSQSADGFVKVTGTGGTTVNGQSSAQFNQRVAGIDVRAGAGNDRVELFNVSTRGGVAVAGGDGNDAIVLNTVSVGGLTVDAGAGNDTVTASRVTVDGSARLTGGAGTDTMSGKMTVGRPSTASEFEARPASPFATASGVRSARG